MVPHVAYDMSQLNAQFNALASGGQARTPAEHATINSFLLHARNLIGFYWPPPAKYRRPGDVFAFDFVPGLVLPQPANTQSAQYLNKMISTRTAHLCLDRASPVAWSAGTIHAALHNAGAEFLSQVPEPYLIRFARSGVLKEFI